MIHVFVAVATRITTTGQYEDLQTDVETCVVAVRTSIEEAEEALLAWAKAQPAEDTELRLTITETVPESAEQWPPMVYEAVSTLTLARTSA